jgi:hypothetical protein
MSKRLLLSIYLSAFFVALALVLVSTLVPMPEGYGMLGHIMAMADGVAVGHCLVEIPFIIIKY